MVVTVVGDARGAFLVGGIHQGGGTFLDELRERGRRDFQGLKIRPGEVPVRLEKGDRKPHGAEAVGDEHPIALVLFIPEDKRVFGCTEGIFLVVRSYDRIGGILLPVNQVLARAVADRSDCLAILFAATEVKKMECSI